MIKRIFFSHLSASRLFTICSMFLFAFVAQTQTIPPPYINYQAVLYDVNGANPNSPLTNQSFSTFVNINDELGNLLYREEHYASTDANGLITVKMGDGLYTAGPITNFNLINWGVGKYYLVVDFNINGTISSTAPEQLVTVPYSFYAGNAGNGMTAVADNGNGTLTFTYANGQTYITPALTGMTGPAGPAGAQGIPGATGATGQNGLNALIKTTTEAAGANCANGGTKIETGLDANGNGVLDAGEVNASQTNYVCNGASNSSTGTLVLNATKSSGQGFAGNTDQTITFDIYALPSVGSFNGTTFNTGANGAGTYLITCSAQNTSVNPFNIGLFVNGIEYAVGGGQGQSLNINRAGISSLVVLGNNDSCVFKTRTLSTGTISLLTTGTRFMIYKLD